MSYLILNDLIDIILWFVCRVVDLWDSILERISRTYETIFSNSENWERKPDNRPAERL